MAARPRQRCALHSKSLEPIRLVGFHQRDTHRPALPNLLLPLHFLRQSLRLHTRALLRIRGYRRREIYVAVTVAVEGVDNHTHDDRQRLCPVHLG